MFGLIYNKNLSDVETAEYIKYYIDDLGCDANAGINLPNLTMKALEKGAVPNAWLAGSIGLDFLLFFEENGVKLEGQSPSPELLEFIKTPKYKEFKEEKFKLIKKLLEHGQDPYHYVKNRTQKELVQ